MKYVESQCFHRGKVLVRVSLNDVITSVTLSACADMSYQYILDHPHSVRSKNHTPIFRYILMALI